MTKKPIPRRQLSADRLARFSRTTPRRLPPGITAAHVSILVANGYLKRRGDGYLRTGKRFSVKKP